MYLSLPSSQHWDYRYSCLPFHRGSRDLNSDPIACTASTLLTSKSPAPILIFWEYVHKGPRQRGFLPNPKCVPFYRLCSSFLTCRLQQKKLINTTCSEHIKSGSVAETLWSDRDECILDFLNTWDWWRLKGEQIGHRAIEPGFGKRCSYLSLLNR